MPVSALEHRVRTGLYSCKRVWTPSRMQYCPSPNVSTATLSHQPSSDHLQIHQSLCIIITEMVTLLLTKGTRCREVLYVLTAHMSSLLVHVLTVVKDWSRFIKTHAIFVISEVFQVVRCSIVKCLPFMVLVTGLISLLLLRAGDVESNPGPWPTILNIDHLMPVKEAIWDVRSQWKDIGRKLGLKEGDIQTIHDTDNGECLHKVLSWWIQSGKAVTSDLLTALESRIIDRPDIVKLVRQQSQEVLEPKLEPLGKRGTFGEVFKVTMPDGRILAGKSFHETTIKREDFDKKLNRELCILQTCDHANVVEYHGQLDVLRKSIDGELMNVPLILMELMDMDFEDYFLKETSSFYHILKVLEQVARGLDYLHMHNPQIVHRDLKASNVLIKFNSISSAELSGPPLAKITDFGTSRFVEYNHTLTTMTTTPGTMFYVAPEQARQHSHCNEKVDIFSFGHLSLSAATQCIIDSLFPIERVDPANPEVIYARTHTQRRGKYFDKLRERVGCDTELESLIEACLHWNHAKRPSAAQLVVKLHKFTEEGSELSSVISTTARETNNYTGISSSSGSAVSYSAAGIN